MAAAAELGRSSGFGTGTVARGLPQETFPLLVERIAPDRALRPSWRTTALFAIKEKRHIVVRYRTPAQTKPKGYEVWQALEVAFSQEPREAFAFKDWPYEYEAPRA